MVERVRTRGGKAQGWEPQKMWWRSVPAPPPTHGRVEIHGCQVRGKDTVGSFRRPGSTVIFREWSRFGRAVAHFEAANAHGRCGRLEVPKGTQSRRSAKVSLISTHRAQAQWSSYLSYPWCSPMGSLVAHRGGMDLLLFRRRLRPKG